MELKSTEIYESLPKEIYENENIMIQGIIDCYFEEEDGIVLLDYKSDYFKEGQEEAIIKKL